MTRFHWTLTQPEADDVMSALAYARQGHENWLAANANHPRAPEIRVQCDRWRSRELDCANLPLPSGAAG